MMRRTDLSDRSLSAHHDEMVLKYLRFASSYRKRQIQELEGTFSDCKETRLSGTDEFSTDEVVGLLDSLCSTIKADVYRSIQTMSNSNGILLKQLFAQAEDSGNTFNIDTSILEDEFLLSSMKKLEAEAESQAQKTVTSMEASSSSSSSMLTAKLPNLQEQAKAEELMKSNAALKKHEMELENELAKLRKELKAKEADHKREMEQLSQKIVDEVASAKANNESAASNDEVMRLGAQIKDLKQSLGDVETSREEAQREVEKLNLLLTSKLDQAPQFKNLKDLLKSKNHKLQSYREKLVELGCKPDDSGDDSDD